MKKYSFIKKIKNFINKYINGARGAVSLLLVLTMSPFMSVSLVLVESARYQDAIESIQEIIDISSFSTLANYDSFLEERFGLLATSQDLDVNDNFNQYLEKNINALGKSVTLNSSYTGATGAFSLADTEVLKEQILEYSELMVSTEVLTDIVDLEELLKKLFEDLEEDKNLQRIEAIEASAELGEEIAKIIEAIQNIIDENGNYGTAMEDYDNSYVDFEIKVLNLASALNAAEIEAEKAIKDAEKAVKDAEKAAKAAKDAEKAIKDAEKATKDAEKATKDEEKATKDEEKATKDAKKAIKDAEKATKDAEKAVKDAKATEKEIKALYSNIYNNKDVKDAIEGVKESRDTYKEATQTAIDELSSLRDNFGPLYEGINKIEEKKHKLNKKKNKLASEESSVTDATGNWLLKIYEATLKVVNDNVEADFKNKITNELSALKGKKEKLNNFSEYDVGSDWNVSYIESNYGLVKVNAINFDFLADLALVMLELNTYAQVESGIKEQTKDLLSVAKSLTEITVLYDPVLNAQVNSTCLYYDVSPSTSSILLKESLDALYKACDNFMEAIEAEGLIGVLKVVEALVTLLYSFGAFIVFIVAWVGEVVINIKNLLVSGPKEIYNNILLYGYGVYNNPNRTTYKADKTLTGYKYEKIFESAGGQYPKSLGAGLTDALLTPSDAEGISTMFRGAEGEYMLAGMNAEVTNQSIVFYNMFLFRLLLNIKPVFSDKYSNAVAVGPTGWLIKIATLIIESMLDLILLVNGGDVYLIKKNIYTSPVGINIFIKDFTKEILSEGSIKDEVENSLKGMVDENEAIGKKFETGLFNADYTEYMLLLLLLTTSQDDYLKRMSNVIQMESAENYKGDHTFNLDKAYTYIETDVNYTLNPMFKLDGFNDTSIFKANLNHYMGY